MLGSLLLLGFVMGLRHALEADHLAAVATLATRSSRLRDVARVAGLWGLGHAGVLVALGAAVALAGTALGEGVARGLETGVGIVLVWLGIDVLRRARRRRLHVHGHRHADGTWHVHAHAHASSGGDGHDHAHARSLGWRALWVGGLHGAAGSAALLLVSVPALDPLRGMAYVGVYALGSILGMLALSAAVSLPLRWAAPGLGRARWAFETLLGSASIALGVALVAQLWSPTA